jgi:uncharacterized membrane protein
MSKLSKHLRKTFVTGLVVTVPLTIIIGAFVWIEERARPLSALLGWDVPGLGLLLAVLAVYLLGLLGRSLIGRGVLTVIDHLLERIPGFHHLYHAWKDVVVLSPRKTSIFHRVVLVPSADGKSAQFGFTSGEPLPGDRHTLCVFLPNIPNPLSGRLMLFDRDSCLPVKMTVAEAFKLLLSIGNYVPADLGGLADRLAPGHPTTTEPAPKSA